MVNPTGYTALDLIGFTDKGAYSSSDNYVKNDLVHYSGNIWRCLIDDTSGIAPIEGVNWTLFIGEPTNLVERIIAPVETDPATNAWAVGRQIIYNDNLYEVIVAITAGDALVAYEDDPTNANIKLADPVETQLLNEITSRQTGDTELRNALTNPNLLDNPWFEINQRNVSTGWNAQFEFGPDRWRKASDTSKTLVVSDNGISEANGDTFSIFSKLDLDNDAIKRIFGKTITASVLYSDGVIESGTLTLQASDYKPSSTIIRFFITQQDQKSHTDYLQLENYTDSTNFVIGVRAGYTVKAVKLELGSVSTLATDTAPNYQQELVKCQRYFYRLQSIGINDWIALGKAWGTSQVNVIVNMPIMRTAPSVVVSDIALILVARGPSSLDAHRINTLNFGYFKKFGHSGVLTLNLSDNTATIGETYILKSDNTVNIDFSAEL